MSDVISILNGLIETSKDGEQGFKTCAENVKDSSIKAKLLDASKRCGEGMRELQAEVRRLGGDPDTSGTVAGSLMGVWIEIKAAVTGKDDAAVLAECERGEDHAVKDYEKALREQLPPETHAILQRQYKGVVDNHDQIRALRDKARAV